MAWAKCDTCNVAVQWFAGKGCRLDRLKCPRCGGKLKGCGWEEVSTAKERVYKKWR
ncbi:MAG: hypothetical protein QXI12_04105 [Candidatus Methanomethyliaceae archaeon]